MIAIVLLFCLLAGCAGSGGTTTCQSTASSGTQVSHSTGQSSAHSSTVSTAPSQPGAAQLLLQQMTLEDMVAQLFIVSMTDDSSISAFLRHYPVGGVVFFGNHIKSPEQLQTSVQKIRSSAKIPLLLSIDEEGGRVARIGNHPKFQVPKVGTAQSVGATGDPEQARNMGSTIGQYLKAYGFDLNFAPVADVFTNPKNTVIGDRAFGSDPYLVAEMVLAAMDGLHSQGIMTCIKHFPGHGDTRGDTHDGFVAMDKTWQQLRSCEIIPFAAALPETDMVMVAHITTPNITSDGLPASLSREMITDKLRGELGYQGLIITDSLAMGAISEGFTSAEAALLALEAGVDILLMPEDFTQAYEGILRAVLEGRVTRSRIAESVLRILELKEKYGML